MRTIKFRGKTELTGEWVYGFFSMGSSVRFEHQNQDERIVPRYLIDDGLLHDVIPETVGQFTGLFDKYGNEIYEGDILLWTRKNVHIEGRPVQDLLYKCVVYYDNDKFSFRFRCELRCGACVGYLDFDDDRADESFVEVIGNIHDNPELLKGGDNA